MSDVFIYVFNMSITASYVIIAVLLVRLLLKRLPKKYSYFLWSVVGFRLAVPISFKSVFSLFSLQPFDMSGVSNDYTGTLDYVPHQYSAGTAVNSEVVNATIHEVNNTFNNVIDSSNATSYAKTGFDFVRLCSYVWLAVSVVLVLYGIISYIVLRARLSNATVIRDNIYESEKIRSPFILGFISPKIYVPLGLDEETFGYVIAHEKCHIRRLDYYIKAFSYLLLAVHWFNPLCYLAFYLMTKDMEMSCDESVINCNEGVRKNYSSALLSFATDGKYGKVTPLCFCENSVKSRIKNVLKFKKPRLVISIIAVVLCVAVVVACAADPDINEKKDNEGVTASGVVDLSDIDSIHIGIPKIIYADEKQLAIFGNCGLVIYDLNYYIVTARVPYSEIQALGATRCLASADGDTIYICRDISDSYYSKYIYNLSENKIVELAEEIPLDCNLYEVYGCDEKFYEKYSDPDTIHSSAVANVGDYTYFLQAYEYDNMNSLELVKFDRSKNKVVRQARIFESIIVYESDGTISDSYGYTINKLDEILSNPYYSSKKYGTIHEMITALTGAEYVGDYGSGLYIYIFRLSDNIYFSVTLYDIIDNFHPISINYYVEDNERAFNNGDGLAMINEDNSGNTIDAMKNVSLKIDQNKATQIALAEVEKNKYKDKYPSSATFELDDPPVLLYRPYYVDKISDNVNADYVYSIVLQSVSGNENDDTVWCSMSIDATTGDVLYTSFYNPYDNV